MVAQTVVSVGPYALKNFLRPIQASTTAGGHRSPAEMTVRSAGRSAGVKAPIKAGGRVTAVILLLARVPRMSAPCTNAACGSRHSVAPDKNVIAISDTEASKPNGAN